MYLSFADPQLHSDLAMCPLPQNVFLPTHLPQKLLDALVNLRRRILKLRCHLLGFFYQGHFVRP